ncbi:hypothetical protein Godav_011255 [Gossypium davidsonii]|uniref:DUF4283 domain-containing protein n=2 Tax=Gossypium TaxID=3633 RepID=A0A7J8R9J9_GOSDV|nr:hypothetical protein [Gossypium davidsonii]MBA0645486.1 hypothetical protein [Gossypium klotzschianum]
MKEELANLNIVDVEEEPLHAHRNANVVKEDYNLCLVWQVLTDSVVHFPAMRNTLANLWHPLGGVSITNIGEKGSLFRFYYMIDMKRVLEGGGVWMGHILESTIKEGAVGGKGRKTRDYLASSTKIDIQLNKDYRNLSNHQPDFDGQTELSLDIEDNLIEVIDGKKRPRIYQMIPNISSNNDSMESEYLMKYQRLLLSRSVGRNENIKLECPWPGAAMGS